MHFDPQNTSRNAYRYKPLRTAIFLNVGVVYANTGISRASTVCQLSVSRAKNISTPNAEVKAPHRLRARPRAPQEAPTPTPRRGCVGILCEPEGTIHILWLATRGVQ